MRNASSPKTRSTRWVAAAPFAVAVLALSGCSSKGGLNSSSPSVESGELGNGGFAFTCDDSVACNRYNVAEKFPDAVSVGASFRIRYVPAQGGSSAGVTIGTIGSTYFSYGPEGLVGVKPGYGTITAIDAQGALVEYKALRIAQPDSFVVYEADYEGDNPLPAQMDFKVGESKSYRALAREKNLPLAGELNYEWTSSDPSVAAVSYSPGGSATVYAKAAGVASLTIEGGSFKEELAVTVKEVSQ